MSDNQQAAAVVLLAAVKAYLSEKDNPIQDVAMILQRRQELREAAVLLDES